GRDRPDVHAGEAADRSVSVTVHVAAGGGIRDGAEIAANESAEFDLIGAADCARRVGVRDRAVRLVEADQPADDRRKEAFERAYAAGFAARAGIRDLSGIEADQAAHGAALRPGAGRGDR